MQFMVVMEFDLASEVEFVALGVAVEGMGIEG
jgi:hypothetical protein